MSYGRAVRQLAVELGELLEAKDAARDLAEYRRFEDDPLAFFREVLNVEHVWSRQEEIAFALGEHPLVCVVGANGVGKDWLLARLALWWAYGKGGLVLITAPTERQVREVLFGEIRRAWHRAGEDELPGELFTSNLRLGPDRSGGIIGMTSTAASRLTGFHGEKVLGVLSEAQALDPFVFEAMRPCAVGADDRLIQSGNPLFPSGPFHDAAKGEAWHTVVVPALEHPNVAEGRTVIPGGPSEAWVERMQVEYGEGSNTYRSRVLSEFPTQDAEGLFDRRWLDDAVLRHETGDLEPLTSGQDKIAALDVARYGNDANLLVVAHGPVVRRIAEWRGLDLMETVEKTEREVAPYGIHRAVSPRHRKAGRLVVDEVGMGAGVVDRLSELRFDVEGFNGGQYGAGQGRFLNRRAEAYWLLRDRLHRGELAIPHDKALIEELLAIRWRPTGDGKVRIEEKREIKGRLGRSPDRADALSMAVWAMEGTTRARFYQFVV